MDYRVTIKFFLNDGRYTFDNIYMNCKAPAEAVEIATKNIEETFQGFADILKVTCNRIHIK